MATFMPLRDAFFFNGLANPCRKRSRHIARLCRLCDKPPFAFRNGLATSLIENRSRRHYSRMNNIKQPGRNNDSTI